MEEVDKKSFIITFAEKKGEKKLIQYQCFSEDNAAEIIAKLRYLLKPKQTLKPTMDMTQNLKHTMPSLKSQTSGGPLIGSYMPS